MNWKPAAKRANTFRVDGGMSLFKPGWPRPFSGSFVSGAGPAASSAFSGTFTGKPGTCAAGHPVTNVNLTGSVTFNS